MGNKALLKHIDSHIDEVKSMMNDMLLGLLNTNGGRIDFHKEDDTILESLNIDVIELEDIYYGGICVTFDNGDTKSFTVLPIEKMRLVLDYIEKTTEDNN